MVSHFSSRYFIHDFSSFISPPHDISHSLSLSFSLSLSTPPLPQKFNSIFGGFANGLAQAREDVIREQNTPYETVLHCRPVAFIGRENLEDGNKILLPTSALEVLARKRVQYPMMFEISNVNGTRKSHCGVMEFSSEEGVAYLPFWMMQNLGLNPEDPIRLKNVTLQKGNFVKLQPHRTAFTEIPNPRVAYVYIYVLFIFCWC